ncbi:hypothetical protein [Pseudomonas marincola]|uniref:hypothetical protein n=1 Tax=Pseudomonas marincola TaxID=437900 RepID=UPI0008F4343B|nr:hypothetical protein [Pseudomonas marincola]SFU14723.1 hypothetical protein SAMN05216264_1152 [Pseudomonas marincola]
MQSRIPLPTDNIYKFYALFGLLLIIFSCGAVIYVSQSTNETVFSTLVEVETLKEQKEPTPSVQVKIEALGKLLEVSKANKDFFNKSLGILIGLAVCIAFYGFYLWQTGLQKVIDETQKVQLEIAKLQLLKLQAELGMV